MLRELADACGDTLLDVHADPDHHRSVLTLAGPAAAVEESVRSVTARAVARLDLRAHSGAHPRLGVVDVVPFVPLVTDPTGRLANPGCLHAAVTARDRFARWAARELALPCFAYGDERPTLPDIRRRAFRSIAPDAGPAAPHPTAGACAVGARPFLVAYNLWLDTADLALARAVAAAIRGPGVRALGLRVGGSVQVSCNLVDPFTAGPAQVHDAVASLVEAAGSGVARCELVGLLPAAVLDAVPPSRWRSLDLRPDVAIEERLATPGTRRWRLPVPAVEPLS